MKIKEYPKAIGDWWSEIEGQELFESSMAVSFCVVSAAIPFAYMFCNLTKSFGLTKSVADLFRCCAPDTFYPYIQRLYHDMISVNSISSLILIVAILIALISCSGAVRGFHREFRRINKVQHLVKNDAYPETNGIVGMMANIIKSVGITLLVILMVFTTLWLLPNLIRLPEEFASSSVGAHALDVNKVIDVLQSNVLSIRLTATIAYMLFVMALFHFQKRKDKKLYEEKCAEFHVEYNHNTIWCALPIALFFVLSFIFDPYYDISSQNSLYGSLYGIIAAFFFVEINSVAIIYAFAFNGAKLSKSIRKAEERAAEEERGRLEETQKKLETERDKLKQQVGQHDSEIRNLQKENENIKTQFRKIVTELNGQIEKLKETIKHLTESQPNESAKKSNFFGRLFGK